MSLKNYSTTAASNNSASPNGAPEGMAMAGVNDTIRQVMADLRTLASPDTIAAAGTTDLGTKDSTFLTLTGTAVTITALGTVSSGIYKAVIYNAAHSLTHNATSLILLGGANRTVAAGDISLFLSEGSGNWRELFYSDVSLGSLTTYLPLAGGTLTGILNQAAGADIASAATVDLTAATGNCPRITGTTATSAFTMNAGQQMWLIANAAWPLTYNATTNKINGGVSYTCASGDLVHVFKDLSGIIQTTVFKADGTAVVAASTSKYIQKVEATPYVLSTSTAASIPFDDTIPQNTEGLSLCTVSITPTSATSRIVVEGFVSLATNSTVEAIATLCDTSIANSLAVGYATTSAADRPVTFPIRAEFAAGSTTARTYDLRVGTNASQLYTNGISTGRKFGGASACTLTVSEITP